MTYNSIQGLVANTFSEYFSGSNNVVFLGNEKGLNYELMHV